nr:iron-sulfur cluster assembly scaffold protein [Halorussus halobius]
MLDALDGGDAFDDARAQVEAYLSSDRYHDRVYEHHRDPKNAGGLADPTFSKHSEETTCGDEGEFHLDVSPDGTIERVAFESESCAVSRAVADLLAGHLEGQSLDAAADLDGWVVDALDGRFPDLRRDCVVGPEEVLREAAQEYLEREPEGIAGDD